MKPYTARTNADIARVTYGRNLGVHVHALEEDLGHTVAQPRRKREDAFILSVTGKDAEKAIEQGFAMHRSWGAEAAISEFIEGAARTVGGHGEAWYELALDTSERRFRVIAAIPDTIKLVPFGAVQILRSDTSNKRFDIHRIPRHVLHNISPPAISPRRWRAMVRDVARLERAQYRGLETSLARATTYLSAEHIRAVNEGILRITSIIQYPPRNFGYDEGVSPALAGYRWALFNAFCAKLRGSIVREVNAILSIAGSSLGFTAVLSDTSTSAEQWEQDSLRIADSDDPDSVIRQVMERER